MRVNCRCGKIVIEISGEPIAQFYCHCDDCQALHGAAYVPESVYPVEGVSVLEGHPVRWTLRRNPRAFCPDCGVRLFIEVVALKLRGVNGCLLPAEAFRPLFHMHCHFAVRPVIDDLPHYKSRPPQFGGSDERAEW